MPPAPAVDLLVGGRLKLNLARVSRPGGSDSGTDLFLAGAVGGEYDLAPHFSLGLEVDLGFFLNSRASGDDAGLLTTGLAFLRLWFQAGRPQGGSSSSSSSSTTGSAPSRPGL